MNDYDGPAPGSEDYATQYWSSPEGRARVAAETAAQNPSKPDRAAEVRDKLDRHTAALQRQAFDGRSRPDLLTDGEAQDLQDELYSLQGGKEAAFAPADKPLMSDSGERWAQWVAEMAGEA